MKLLEEFRINIPVKVKKIEQGEGLVTLLPNKKKAIIEYFHEGDLFDMVATLRLGLDYSPLLTTFYFQRNYTEEEAGFMREFYLLSLPLIKTWAFLNAVRYVGEERVKREAKEISDYVNIAYMWVIPESREEQAVKQIHYTTAYLLLKYVAKEKVNLRFEGEYKKEWERYVELVERLIHQKPSPYLLTRIPEETKAPYRVKVRKVPYPHYELNLR